MVYVRLLFQRPPFMHGRSNRNAYGFTMKVLNPACGNREVFRAPLHEIARLTHAKMGGICLFYVHLYRKIPDLYVWWYD